MPFHKFSIEPVKLARKPLPPDKNINELEAVTNNTLVQVLRQLSSLITVANVIFSNVSVECEKLNERTTCLKKRINDCEKKANDLNAKRVSVPVGDLASFSLVRHHYQTNYSIDTSTLFLQNNRPDWVKEKYAKVTLQSENEPGTSGRSSAITKHSYPLQRFLEHYHWNDDLEEDQKAYRYIVCRPVIGDSKWRAHLDIETRKPAQLLRLREKAATRAKNLQLSYDVLNSSTSESYRDESIEMQDLDEFDSDIPDLPSPEERLIALSMEYPSTVVSVDVSGKGFQRMTTLRRSLIHGDFLIKRKKRKQRRNTICEGSTSKELRNLHTKSIQTDADELAGSSSSSRLKDNGPIHLSSKDFPPVRFRGNRRSYVQTERSSLYASVDIIGPKVEKKKRYSMDPKALSSVATKTHSEEEVTKKSGKKGRVRSLLPISTISAAMTVAVKLRGGLKDAVNGNSKSKGRKEEGGQSSSGNWSATSSVRGSVIDASEAQRLPNTSEVGSCSETSRSSIEKDSVLSDTTGGSKIDTKANGYSSDISTAASNTENLTSQATTFGTERKWNDSSSDRSGTLTPEHIGGGTNTGDSSSTPRMLSPKFVHRRRYSGSQHGPGSVTNDDESESVYSVDTDGYYTSMHTDSGLKMKNMSPKRKEEHYGKPVCRRESTSSVSTIGNISVNSILSRIAYETGSNQSSITYRGPPTPPPRVTSMHFEKPAELNNNKSEKIKLDELDLPPPPPSPPESDTEIREKRLHQKTKISSTHYPFMCTVSPESSDEEPKPTVDVLDNVLKNNINSFVPLGFNMYGDISAPKSNIFGVSLPDTPPYTPNEDSVLSSFSSKPANTSIKSMEYKNKIIPPSPLASPTPNQPVVILKTSNQRVPMIPLKYAQHITVTPMARSGRVEPADTWSSNESSSSSGGNVTGVVKARVSPFIIRAQPVGRKSPIDSAQSSTIERPGAKVTLDQDGQVIFSSNSLGRRRDNHPMNYLHLSPTKMTERKWATLPTRFGQNPSNRAPSPITSPTRFGYSSLPRQMFYRPKSPYSTTDTIKIDLLDEKPSKNRIPSQNQLSRNPSQSSSESLSLLKKKPMSNEDLFTAIHNCKKKLNLRPDLEKSPASSRCNSPICPKISPKKELAESGSFSSRNGALSPTNLSSGYSRNGALSPTNLSSGYSSGRSTPNRAMAIDRLGINRQTSLRDFKLLLSQTGTSSPVIKKSATEILKANSPTIINPRSLPGSPYHELNSFNPATNRPISVTPTPTSSHEWGGHSTVPFKRGSRGRLSLQTRYDNYNCPPIMEDCLEESENDRSKSPKRDFHFTPISKLPANYNSYQHGMNWHSSSNPNTPGLSTTPIKPSTSTWV